MARRRSPVYHVDYQYMIARLRQARRRAKLTQAQVAQKLNRPQQYVQRVESGERRIDPIELRALAKIYRQPLTFFFPRRQ